jgi:ABC-type glycerol-3-phosphate transport system substrate-binding protein
MGQGGPGGMTNSSLIPQSIAALNDGCLVSFARQGIIQYDANGKEVRKYSDAAADGRGGMGGRGGGASLAVFGNTMACADSGKGEILLYDLTTGKQQSKAAYEGLSANTFVGHDAKGLFVADSTGISRWDGSSWKLIVDGSLTSLIMPNLTVQDALDSGDGWYVFLGGQMDQSGQLLRLRYDPNIAAQPDKILTVFTLYDNTTMRVAAGEFQSAHPDVKVNVEVGIATRMITNARGMPEESADDSVTPEDVIRSLNTQLLAGKGPDLIVLDGLPLQSYIEKGVLKEIGALTQRLANEEGLLLNLASAYAFNGKTYGLPTRFTLPVMLGDSNQLKKLHSFGDLVQAVKAYGKQEPALLRAPDQLWRDDGLITYGYDACVNDFTKKDGSLDEAALAQYLRNALDLTQAMRDITPEANQPGGRALFAATGGGFGRRLDAGGMDIAGGNALIHAQILSNTMGFAMLANQLGQMEGMEVASLFGQKTFTPVGGVGIVAAGKQQALAEQFLQMAVGTAVQNNFMADAFPVNRASLNTMLAQLKERFVETMGATFSDMNFIPLCESLQTPLFVDEYVKTAVEAQAAALVRGELTPEDAAAKIVANTKLYLAE